MPRPVDWTSAALEGITNSGVEGWRDGGSLLFGTQARGRGDGILMVLSPNAAASFCIYKVQTFGSMNIIDEPAFTLVAGSLKRTRSL